jgi:iron complex outermembrane recepter protein
MIFKEKRDTFDIDLQHRFPIAPRNDLIWGTAYRVTADHVGNSSTISLNPDHRTLNLFSAFVQDEISLIPDRLRMTLGSKFEHNDFTGFEYQPSGRILWTPREHQTLWASVSRAVRTPSRAEDDVILNQVVPAGAIAPGSPAFVTTIYGNRDIVSEELLAYEIGYRFKPHRTLTFDLAAFYNDYDHLRSQEPGPSPTQPVILPTVPIHVANLLYGETYGLEAAATWELTRWWRLQPAYTYLDMQLHRRTGSGDITSEQDEGKSPCHQFIIRSSMDLPQHLFLDGNVRYVDRLPALDIPSYVTVDARLAWRPKPNWEFAVVGQNLLHERHREFSPSFIATRETEIERGVYGKVTVRF